MELVYESELKHYGVPGMKWGVKRSTGSTGGSGSSRKKMSLVNRMKLKRKMTTSMKERKELYMDSKNVTAKAPKGKHMMVTGQYSQKRGGKVYTSAHLVNDAGKVKMSYINGKDGHRYIASGKDYISKLDLNKYFKNTKNMNIEYDVYE